MNIIKIVVQMLFTTDIDIISHYVYGGLTPNMQVVMCDHGRRVEFIGSRSILSYLLYTLSQFKMVSL